MADQNSNATNERGQYVPRHGQSRTKVHRCWQSMQQRCHNASNHNFARYGGRGIKVCDRWRKSFEAFLEDMGYPPSPIHSLGRVDNNGNYEPSNCRWETPVQQSQNTRATRLLTHDGKTMCAAKWARETGINIITLHKRLRIGWSVSDALTTPVRKDSRNR